MGVHGLSTFLREKRRNVAKQVVFKAEHAAVTPVVIDGWSFIYNLFADTSLPWVYGGEYADFSALVARVVKAWLIVGLKPYFVFDGPYVPAKFAVAISRRTDVIVNRSLLFFRTSSASRSTSRFLNEIRMLIPLAYTVCIGTLQSFLVSNPDSLEVHFADGEGDPFAVELAARVGGYIIGQDSDFSVFSSDGYKGYMPIDEMVWVAPTSGNDGDTSENDDGFLTVRKGRNNGKANDKISLGRGIVPPESTAITDNLSLSTSIFSPRDLAEYLKLPVTLLPLLGALVGNDFTANTSASAPRRILRQYLFDRRLTPVQRIAHAADTLVSVLRPPQNSSIKRKAKPPRSVMELITVTVSSLLGARTNLSENEQTALIERIVEATLPYAIPTSIRSDDGVSLWPSDICALHPTFICPLMALLDREANEDLSLLSVSSRHQHERQKQIMRLYILAYRHGKFAPSIMNALSTGTYWSQVNLENPDLESVSRSIGRPIRVFGYSLLEDGVGLAEQVVVEEKTDMRGSQTEEEDDDELIDVVEENSDVEEGAGGDISPDVDKLDSALRGLQLIDKDEDSVTDMTDSSLSQSVTDTVPEVASKNPSRKTIMEYVRKGTRFVPEEVEVPSLVSFLQQEETKDVESSIVDSSTPSEGRVPLQLIQLQTAQVRLQILMRFLQSDIPSIHALDPNLLLPALSVRWVVLRMHQRCITHGKTKERERERWTRIEARVFLSLFSGLSMPFEHQPESKTDALANDVSAITSSTPFVPPSGPARVPIFERSIQLTAQILAALHSVEHLIQILLLTDRIPTNCALKFSGRKFHAMLANTGDAALSGTALQIPAVQQGLWKAVEDELGDCFAADDRSSRKTKKAKNTGIEGVVVTKQAFRKPVGMFDLLGAETI